MGKGAPRVGLSSQLWKATPVLTADTPFPIVGVMVTVGMAGNVAGSLARGAAGSIIRLVEGMAHLAGRVLHGHGAMDAVVRTDISLDIKLGI